MFFDEAFVFDLIDWMLCRKQEGDHPCITGDCNHEDDKRCRWELLRDYMEERTAMLDWKKRTEGQ